LFHLKAGADLTCFRIGQVRW